MKEDGAPAASGTRAPRILVADDEQGFRDLIAYELGARGYQVVAAANGEEAIQKARAEAVDVVVSDLTMPKRDGLEALKALKAVDPHLEVIMVTGYATLENAVESMKRGAYDFITKPFQVDDLARLIDKALEKRRLTRKVGELEEINRFKSEFLANMSHELRTPMNAILGYTSLHLDRVYGEFSPKQEEALKRVEAAGKSLLGLINSILDLSRLAAGRMPVYKEEFNLGDLVREVLEMMECLAKAKGLSLAWEGGRGLRLRSDRTKVKQILVNLIGNGIKFTSQGHVRVEAERAPDGSRVFVRVQDSGIGIKASDIPLLFSEFKQLDASPTREHGGTGLGLSLSRKFAQLLGGDIAVESVPQAGSTFTVELPCESRELAEAADAYPAVPEEKGGKVLLAIDDDPEVLALLRDSLHGSGYAFAGALNGEDGLALARKLKPFAVTLDIMMPHRDGWSVLQAIKNDPELKSIPVLMVSILDNKSLGFSLGVADYIVKPFERRELLEKLRAVEGEGGRAASESRGAGRTILVVDDEPSVVEYLCDTLRFYGYAVESASSGGRALKRLAEGPPPDILFLDLMMPEISGFDVIEAVGRDPRLAGMAVIVLTAKHLTPEENDYLQSRVELVIQKGSKGLSEILDIVRRRLHALEGAR